MANKYEQKTKNAPREPALSYHIHIRHPTTKQANTKVRIHIHTYSDQDTDRDRTYSGSSRMYHVMYTAANIAEALKIRFSSVR